MSLGEVDTLNLLTEKLDGLFTDSQGYYESFLDMNNLYKNGKIGEKEFFAKLGDYVVAYSALEFLTVKVILELKKSIDKISQGQAPGGTQSPGLMPGMVYDGSGIKIGNAGQIGIDDTKSLVLLINKDDGTNVTVPWSQIKKVGEIILLKGADDVAKPDDGCLECGKSNKPGSKFCEHCGSKI